MKGDAVDTLSRSSLFTLPSHAGTEILISEAGSVSMCSLLAREKWGWRAGLYPSFQFLARWTELAQNGGPKQENVLAASEEGRGAGGERDTGGTAHVTRMEKGARSKLWSARCGNKQSSCSTFGISLRGSEAAAPAHARCGLRAPAGGPGRPPVSGLPGWGGAGSSAPAAPHGISNALIARRSSIAR